MKLLNTDANLIISPYIFVYIFKIKFASVSIVFWYYFLVIIQNTINTQMKLLKIRLHYSNFIQSRIPTNLYIQSL